jgi:hypothetical protein
MMRWTKQMNVGLLLAVVAGSPLGARAAQAPGVAPNVDDDSAPPPAAPATPTPPVAEPRPQTEPVVTQPATSVDRDRAQAAALRAEARALRDRLTSDPDVQRQYLVYQYTGDADLAPQVKELMARVAAAEKQAHELEQRALFPADR